MKLVAAIVSCAVLLAACGSSKPGGHQAAYTAGLNFAKCMRAHGVPDFPDPGSGGGIQIPNGTNPAAPSFQAAQKACARDLPGGPFRGQATAAQKQRLLAMSQCMRAHGLTDFPDPVATPPPPTAGFGLAFGSPGGFIAIPRSMIDSPDFNQAAAACGLPGAGRGPGPKSQAAVTKP
ncbi:MAG TPA: hypothetical protein VG405_01620 [Solirubrobacteraceae bacterium]|nr:hypothetical protein [Solirubrobacteraceae bacterium]